MRFEYRHFISTVEIFLGQVFFSEFLLQETLFFFFRRAHIAQLREGGNNDNVVQSDSIDRMKLLHTHRDNETFLSFCS